MPSVSITSFDALKSSLSTYTEALSFAISSSLILTLSHVRPRISPTRKEQAKARFIATNSFASLQLSSALRMISAVQISLGFLSTFGSVTKSNGLRAMTSQRTACLKADLSNFTTFSMFAGVMYSVFLRLPPTSTGCVLCSVLMYLSASLGVISFISLSPMMGTI